MPTPVLPHTMLAAPLPRCASHTLCTCARSRARIHVTPPPLPLLAGAGGRPPVGSRNGGKSASFFGSNDAAGAAAASLCIMGQRQVTDGQCACDYILWRHAAAHQTRTNAPR